MLVLDIHIPVVSPRIAYVAAFVMGRLGLDYRLTTEGAAAGQISLRYEGREIRFNTDGLLAEQDIQTVRKTEALQALQQYSKDGMLPGAFFDLVFFLLSRYEEYLPFTSDRHQRYPAEESVLYQAGLLKVPVIDEWIQQLRQRIETYLLLVVPPPPAFEWLPTYDIDISHAFFHRPWWRTAGAIAKECLRDRPLLALRMKVWRGLVPDPFNAFADMDAWHEKLHTQPVYFWLLADYGPFDKNVSPAEKVMQQLVQRTASRYMTGIHPSYRSNEDPSAFEAELQRYAALTGNKASKSRQHFIRCRLPETYRRLEKAGILEDYSMGYGSHNGFRAGVSIPFHWYDLEQERPTHLLVHPFAFMEATNLFQLHHSSDAALAELLQITEKVRKAGGRLVTIFHNYTLGQNNPYRGWREMYLRFLDQMKTQA
jgi:hypothetical protein